MSSALATGRGRALLTRAREERPLKVAGVPGAHGLRMGRELRPRYEHALPHTSPDEPVRGAGRTAGSAVRGEDTAPRHGVYPQGEIGALLTLLNGREEFERNLRRLRRGTHSTETQP